MLEGQWGKGKIVHFGNRHEHHQATESLQGVVSRLFGKLKWVFMKETKRDLSSGMPAPSLKWCSAQSHITSASSPCSVLSLHPAKPYNLQETVLLDPALQIPVLPLYKPDGNDFTFWSAFAHTTKPFLPESLQSTHRCSRSKNSLKRREALRF